MKAKSLHRRFCVNENCRSVGAKAKVHALGLCEACYQALWRERKVDPEIEKREAARGNLKRLRSQMHARWPKVAEAPANKPNTAR